MMALLRNSMLYLNASLWLGVLYFSLCEDGKAAVLSYVSLALTVLMTKYGFWDNYISASVVIGFISKVLIIGGILLAIFSRFGNTSFYSICLGILMLKMKWEIESRASNVCSNINMAVVNDTKDEFKPIIPQKSAIQLQKVEAVQMEESRIKDIDEIHKSKALSRITPGHNEAKEREKSYEDIMASRKNYLNRSPLNFPKIVSNNVSVNMDLLKQTFKHLNKIEENTKVQSNNFIKQDDLTLKHQEKFESIYDIGGRSLQDPREFALTEVDPSNIKLELKQIQSKNWKFPEKSKALNNATQKKNIFRDDMLKQLNIIAKKLENINFQKTEMRKDLENASNVSSNINMTVLNDKDEFKPIIPQKSPIQLQKFKIAQMEENKIKDIDEVHKSNALLLIITPEHYKAKELEKTCEDMATSNKNYWNRPPLNFPDIASDHVSVNKDLLKQNIKNNLNKNEGDTKAQSDNFKKHELTLKHHEKLFESIYGIGGSSMIKMQDPQELALTEVDTSNIKLELKQIQERNWKFPEKSKALNDATQKKNIFRDDILKQLNIIAKKLENICCQKTEMRKDLANASSVCSNINMAVLNDAKDEFKPIIPQKSPIQLQKVKIAQMEENKVKDIDEVHNSNALLPITPEHYKAKELEKTCEDMAASPKDYWNRPPLNFPDIASDHVSVNKDLRKQNIKNNLNKNEGDTKAQSDNFKKQNDLTLKHHQKLLESIYGIGGSSLIKMKDPQEFALSEVDQSNIKLELKQIQETNWKFPEKSKALNDATQKKNIFRDDILKQLNIIAKKLNINCQKIEMRQELANAEDNINTHVAQDVMKNFSSLNMFQKNLDNIKDKFHQKSVRFFDDKVNLLIFNKFINLDIDEQPPKSNKTFKGTNTEIDPESLASKIDLKRENCSEIDESKPKTKCTRLASGKSSDIQHENDTCSRQLKSISEQITENVNLKTISTKNDLKVLQVSEKPLESKVLNNSCMNVDFDGEASNGNELGDEKENGRDENARKPSENVRVTHSQTLVEGVVNRIDLGFIYAVGF